MMVVKKNRILLMLLLILGNIWYFSPKEAELKKFYIHNISETIMTPIKLTYPVSDADYQCFISDSILVDSLSLLMKEMKKSERSYSDHTYIALKIYYEPNSDPKFLLYDRFSIKYDEEVFEKDRKLINFINRISNVRDSGHVAN